jgi:ankyrin repeat protein
MPIVCSQLGRLVKHWAGNDSLCLEKVGELIERCKQRKDEKVNHENLEYLSQGTILQELIKGELKNVLGKTFLHIAVEKEKFMMASFLLWHGAHTAVKDRYDNTPFSLVMSCSKDAPLWAALLLYHMHISSENRSVLSPNDLEKAEKYLFCRGSVTLFSEVGSSNGSQISFTESPKALGLS